ncbi:hypothetical protein GGQ04_003164 [Salinibacter ruber]|uniref:Uncharacterized protein n=1 Tax=Salinibacter ruber TaxID=146919 RepID=A0A9X2UVP9_9BACT|nr:hypothetical protein [Salinibacter ruber]MCS3711799.1 hypothetical protein [Salinibacter ruber]MCS4048007.1 hypothetical protein [Salinibacter ruber]MCS4142642.1 hypothetical protein [Salinibacter ruber]MCS4181872.1 hypothetical protein [Salinibacter ruber]
MKINRQHFHETEDELAPDFPSSERGLHSDKWNPHAHSI